MGGTYRQTMKRSMSAMTGPRDTGSGDQSKEPVQRRALSESPAAIISVRKSHDSRLPKWIADVAFQTALGVAAEGTTPHQTAASPSNSIDIDEVEHEHAGKPTNPQKDAAKLTIP